MAIVAVLCLGLAVAAAAWCLMSIGQAPRVLPPEEAERWRLLGRRSWACRAFEPAVLALAGLNRRWLGGVVGWLQGRLAAAGTGPAWRPEEFLAAQQVEALPALALGGLFGMVMVGPGGAVLLGAAVYGAVLVAMVRQVSRLARRRADLLQARLPAAVDLMALMMEAGAGTLRECLQKVAAENADHPLGEEVERVLLQTDQGASQADALRAMDRRLNVPEVRELVSALTNAEERGMPLKAALRDLAVQMRLRQVQHLERAAEEARVHITWPGLLVTAACLVIVAMPIVFSWSSR